jgi:UDP-N-acetylglucosamine 2-epimerase (non-hydrolysing)
MFASIYTQSAPILKSEKPDIIFVLGDTNTVPIFCILARKLAIPIAHIEAGLRSFNEVSVEEVNRKIGGAIALVHFAPTELNRAFLLKEGVLNERIFVVGNTIIDVLKKYGSKIHATKFDFGDRKALFTVHRPTNVDLKNRLHKIIQILKRVCNHLTVIFPVHPRTKARLAHYKYFDMLKKIPNLIVTEPLPYFETIALIKDADVIITDSGGLQEEASYFKKPVITLRGSTPRWETVLQGTNVLTNLNVDDVEKNLRKVLSQKFKKYLNTVSCPYGNGTAAKRILNITYQLYSKNKLCYKAPNFTGIGKNLLIKRLGLDYDYGF